MRKKILFVLPGFNFGGTVFSTLNMISLIQDRYDISVLPMHPYGPVRTNYQNINIIQPDCSLMAVAAMPSELERNSINRIKLNFFKLINHICMRCNIDFTKYIYKKQAESLMKKYNFDVVASCQEYMATDFASYFSSYRIIAWNRTEMSIHIPNMSEVGKKRMNDTYCKFDKIVSVSQTTSDDLASCFTDIKDKCVAIHNIQNFENIIRKSEEYIEDSFDKGIFNIVSVGRIAKQKQFYRIPAIAKKLHDELELNFKWYIIGDGNVLGENDRLQSELDKYNNREYVVCIGSRLNPYPYIAAADLLVNTSYYEACPRVVAEAQILHTPVICADFSSAKEFVKNGENGFIDTIDMLWKPIADMISDKDTYNRIKTNCNNYTSENDAIIMQLHSLFD